MTREPLTIQRSLLQHQIEELGRHGATDDHGVTRTQYDHAWVGARSALARWFAEAGLEVHGDAAGNLFGRLPGTDTDRTILTGSHLDTVINGGKYDGALGIHAGLAALRALRDTHGPPRRSLEVVALCEEENSRFHGNYFGSRAMLGLIADHEPDTLHDAAGTSLADAMRGAGLEPSRLPEATRTDLDTFLELHIEQGTTLHRSQVPVGVVTSIVGLSWLSITVTGRQDHAGIPMAERHDALRGATRMATAVTDHVHSQVPEAVATIGAWQTLPGATNVVPREVRFTVDLRHPDDTTRYRLVEQITKQCAEIASAQSLEVTVETVWDEPAAPLDSQLRQTLIDTTDTAGHRLTELPSRAVHDSQLLSRHLPTAMLFVPSIDGRSHTPEEHTPLDDCVRGAHALAAALHSLAY